MRLPLQKSESVKSIDTLIESVLAEMRMMGVDSEEYPRLMTYLERLHELKAKERPQRVSRDTVALIAGNLVGILLIVAYEQEHVMTSKGFAQLIRPKGTT